MDGCVGYKRHREQRLRCGEPYIAHYDDHRVVVDVEEGKPSIAAAENDEERVDEFKKFGEVEDLSPEEDRALWRD